MFLRLCCVFFLFGFCCSDGLDSSESSPLHEAVYLNDVRLVRSLIATGADPNDADSHGFTPLYFAVYMGNFEIADLLIAASADPNKSNLHGESVLYFMKMVRPPKYKEMIALIKKHTESIKYIEKEKILLKRIGHIWKIEKSIRLKPKQSGFSEVSFELTGAHPTHFYRYLKKRVCNKRSGADSILSPANGQFEYQGDGVGRDFFVDHTGHLKEFLKYGSRIYHQPDAELILKRILSGKPTPVSTGWCEHAVQLLFWNDRLVICNRGPESKHPIEMFLFDKSKLNVRLIESLIRLQTKDRDTFIDMMGRSLPAALDLKKGDLERYFEKYSLISYQKVGNCAWDSVEGVVYALIVLDALNLSSSGRGSIDESVVRRVMLQKFGELKLCLSYLKFETLEHYLDLHLEGHSHYYIDKDLLLTLLQKVDFDDFKVSRLVKMIKSCLEREDASINK